MRQVEQWEKGSYQTAGMFGEETRLILVIVGRIQNILAEMRFFLNSVLEELHLNLLSLL